MTSRTATTIAIAVSWLAAVNVVSSTSTGPPPGAAGVPAGGDVSAEMTCASAECHNSSDVNPDAMGKIELLGVPQAYTPGEHYVLTLRVSHAAAKRWGFQLTAVALDNWQGAGDFAPLAGDTTTQRISGGPGDRNYIEHGVSGRAATGIGATGQHSWRFEWIGPGRDVGQIAFFASANAANGDGSPSGDSIYSSGMPLARTAGQRARIAVPTFPLKRAHEAPSPCASSARRGTDRLSDRRPCGVLGGKSPKGQG
ncbi:MAG: choice-of-anchor V domain-containing protein [Vicinamibacterales bacterium]